MKNLLLIISLLLTFTNVKSQDNTAIEAKYASYFDLPRESVFLHLNKSTFIKGESIWYKGYIYNRKDSVPFKETTNLYVGLYDAEGNQLQKSIVRAQNGYAIGNMKMDSTYTTGDYYLKASTNWMRNFNEDDAFIQKIKFLNNEANPSITKELAYDLQLLPEGGHLVHDVHGVVGVKLIDNKGLGIIFKEGILLDNNNNKVTDFKSNAFGMARFSFTPHKDKNYHVLVTLNGGKELKAKLPDINSTGIVLRAQQNPGKEGFMISIATNKATYKKIKKKPYHLLIHKNGASKGSPFVFNRSEKEIIIPLTGDFLFEGINIITLFDEQQNPIAERMIFNQHKWEPTEALVAINEMANDSISLGLQVFSDINIEKNLSVSVLPSETRAYNQKNTILSEFLLKPYLRGYIENPGYYFMDDNRRREFDLDLLLLTQGWSRYEWNNIFNRVPNPVFEFENGLTLKGTFNDPNLDKYTKFLLEESKYHESKLFDLKKPDFEIPNVFYDTNEEVEMLLVKKNGKLKAHGLFAKTLAKLTTDRLTEKHFNTSSIYLDPVPNLNYELEEPETIVLEEINVVAEALDKQFKYYGFINSANDVKVDLDIAIRFPFVTDIIRRKSAYDVNDNVPGQVTIVNRRRSSLGNQQAPIVYFDDTRLFGGLDILWQLRTSEIERITFEPFGVYEGSRGAAGVIRIWSRSTDLFDEFLKKRPQVFIDNSIAYAPVKNYYAPKYQYASPLFRYFGVVHWEPNLITDHKGRAYLKIPNTGLREVSLFIEGMSKTGELISTMKKVRIQKASVK
jgi:hypothetical protein